MDKVSDIKKVNKLSKMIYKKTVEPSTRKNKKYMIMNEDNKLVHYQALTATEELENEKKTDPYKEELSVSPELRTIFTWYRNAYTGIGNDKIAFRRNIGQQ